MSLLGTKTGQWTIRLLYDEMPAQSRGVSAARSRFFGMTQTNFSLTSVFWEYPPCGGLPSSGVCANLYVWVVHTSPSFRVRVPLDNLANIRRCHTYIVLTLTCQRCPVIYRHWLSRTNLRICRKVLIVTLCSKLFTGGLGSVIFEINSDSFAFPNKYWL